jgi:hypothetical protein
VAKVKLTSANCDATGAAEEAGKFRNRAYLPPVTHESHPVGAFLLPVMLVARAAYWTYVTRHDANAWAERLTDVQEHVTRAVAALNASSADPVLRAFHMIDVFHCTQPKGDSHPTRNRAYSTAGSHASGRSSFRQKFAKLTPQRTGFEPLHAAVGKCT